MAIKPNAGQLRGVRAVRDPEGILLDSFEDPMGGKVGYIIVYGEGLPAVFDGTTWHPITDETEQEWTDALQERIVKQGTAISQAAATNQIYAQLATLMNISVGAGVGGATDSRAPGSDTIYFGV